MKIAIKAVTAAVLGLFCFLQTPVWSQPGDNILSVQQGAFVQLAAEVTPSVVNIDVEKREVRKAIELPFDDPFFRQFFGDFQKPRQEERVVAGQGSGVIISADGMILTNNHVVAGARLINITLKDGRKFKASLVGTDATTDLAVVKIETKEAFPAAKIGSSEDLPIGSWLMAVGNPYGLEETVTVGILSGKGRVIGAGLYDDFLQTDAAINPGNSGGGLFNLKGELIGINTAVAGQNLGFAIPIEMAQKIALDLTKLGKVERGYLGVGIQELSSSLREALRLPADIKGVLISQALKDGPGAKAGLLAGDVVTKYNGVPVERERALLAMVAQSPINTPQQVEVWREGKLLTLAVRTAERPSDEAKVKLKADDRTSSQAPSPLQRLGLEVIDLTPSLAERLSLPYTAGALVQVVKEGSVAYRAGIRPRDLIIKADGEKVTSALSFGRIVESVHGSVALLVARGAQTFFVGLDSGS